MTGHVVLHVHQRFLPYNSGSTVRLLRLIEIDHKKSNRKHIVLCWDGGDPTLPRCETVEDICIYRFSRYFEILYRLPWIIFYYRPIIIHAHNFRPGFYALPYIILFRNSILELHAYYEPKIFLQKIFMLCQKKLMRK